MVTDNKICPCVNDPVRKEYLPDIRSICKLCSPVQIHHDKVCLMFVSRTPDVLPDFVDVPVSNAWIVCCGFWRLATSIVPEERNPCAPQIHHDWPVRFRFVPPCPDVTYSNRVKIRNCIEKSDVAEVMDVVVRKIDDIDASGEKGVEISRMHPEIVRFLNFLAAGSNRTFQVHHSNIRTIKDIEIIEREIHRIAGVVLVVPCEKTVTPKAQDHARRWVFARATGSKRGISYRIPRTMRGIGRIIHQEE
jgi:hypothetical protein